MKNVEISAERTYSVDFDEYWQTKLLDIVHDRQAVAFVPRSLRNLTEKLPANFSVIELPDGEKQKDSQIFIDALDNLAKLGIGRSGVLIGIGGGATTDLVGFTAATYLRGIDWVAVPTSLAGMVDAAVGGKTGINLLSGKNLAGAFHSPAKVIVNIGFLESLSNRDLKAGMAEVAKCGFIADVRILDLISDGWRKSIPELVYRAVAVKASVVSRDFKESYEREILNYGHTLGHAIEKHSNYGLRHGECVSIGLIYAAELSRRFSGLSNEEADRHREILNTLELPITYQPGVWDSLYQIMQSDKKKKSTTIRFVTLQGLGKPTRLEDTNERELREIYLEKIGR